MRMRTLLALAFVASLPAIAAAQAPPVTATPPAAVKQMWGGCTSNTPTGTQYCPATGRLSISTSINGNQFVTGWPMTFTGITIALINPEGAAATLTATLAYCTNAGCGTVNTTAVTCVAGNNASSNSCGGFSVYLPAGTPIAIQTVQNGTGTASTSSFTLTYQ